MSEYVGVVSKGSEDGSLLRAVLAVYQHNYTSAVELINKLRDTVDTDLTAMFVCALWYSQTEIATFRANESYERAYGAMVTVQRLTELEEAMQDQLMPERRAPIAQMWWSRLQARLMAIC